MHIPLLLSQFQLTADGLVLAGIGVAGLIVNGLISRWAGAKGAGVYEERIANHGKKLEEHDDKFVALDETNRRQWAEISRNSTDVAFIKGKLDA